MAKVGVIGVGSIGSVLARGFAGIGHRVVINDVYPGAEGLPYQSTTKADIGATCDFAVIAVPTPNTEFGGDASAIDAVLSEFTPAHDAQVIIRSTMPPGSTAELASKHQRDLVFMPEFLRDRSDVDDFYEVDRMVLSGPPEARNRARTLCEHPQRRIGQVIETDYLTAELGKLAHNAFFATKVSFANQMRLIAEAEGADPETVMDIVTADSRNTSSHLDPMLGPYGGACLVPGTLVDTPTGPVAIEDLEIGQTVCDSEGMTTVTGKQSRVVDETVSITARGRELVGSSDHIHLAWNGQRGGAEQKQLQNIDLRDSVIFPLPRYEPVEGIDLGEKPNGCIQWWPGDFEVTPQFARIMGLYLAEGYRSSSPEALMWSFGEAEEDLADELVGLLEGEGFNPYKRFKETDGTYGPSRTWVVRVRSQGLYLLFEELGMGGTAAEKGAPLLGGENAKALIGGWLDGDGHHHAGTISGFSRSVQMIQEITRMLLSLGINPVIDRDGQRIRISTRREVERVASWGGTYQFDPGRYVDDTEYASPTMDGIGVGWSVDVNGVERIDGLQRVIAIETESGEYIANGMLTHNCLPKDIGMLRYYANIDQDRPTPLLDGTIAMNEMAKESYEYRDIEGNWPNVTVAGE